MKLWKRTIAVMLASACALSSALPAVWADEASDESTVAAAASIDNRYPAVLSSALQVKVKSLLSERTLNGTRLGVVVKMYNVWDSTVRVPDFELRVQAAGGGSYTLRGSADNAGSVAPMSSVELSYMAQVDKGDRVVPASLQWIDVDKDVYPKVETVKLDLPADGLVWYGDGSAFADADRVKAWGETFDIPSVDSPLQYTPVSLTSDFKGQKPVKLLKLLVHNPSEQSESVPAFRIDGFAGKELYKGEQAGASAGQAPLTVDPQTDKYMYVAIPTDADTQLTDFTITTAESYRIPNRTDGSAVVSYNVGRLSVYAPEAAAAGSTGAGTGTYAWGTPLVFDPLNETVHPDLSVTIADFRLYENKGQGYQTGIVKLKLTNRSDKPVPVPQAAAELIGPSGASYTGSRTGAGAGAQTVVPNTAYIVNYTFVLPLDDTGVGFTFRLNDDKSAAPYKTPIAETKLDAVTTPIDAHSLGLYPFRVDIRSWSLSNLASMNPATASYNYTYKLKWDIDLQSADAVIVDPGYSKLLLELVNGSGRKIASTTVTLTGDGSVSSGEQTLYMLDSPNDQFEHPVTVNIYETIETSAGQARRLVGTLKD
jgi:hypothetical protein